MGIRGFFSKGDSADPIAQQLELTKAQLLLQERLHFSTTSQYYNQNTPSQAGSLNTSGQKYPDGLSSSGMSRAFNHSRLRTNVRDAMYDSVQGRGIATRFADTVADVGLRARLEPNVEILGITEEKAEEFSRKASAAINTWLGSKDSSVDGVNTGFQNQWLYSFSQQRDNDMYVMLNYSDDDELISPLQMQFIDPDQINGYGYTYTTGYQQPQTLGIKHDGKGREISYDVTILVDGKYKRVPVSRVLPGGRLQMLHGFRPEYAGQKQGYALYAHLLQEFEDLTSLQQAHIQKAINQSSWVFYTKPGKDAPASQGIADVANQKASIISQYLGAAEIDNLTSDQQAAFVANVVPEFSMRQPGSLWNMTMRGGEDMKAVEQTAPVDKFGDFVEAMVSYLSSSTGMPIEVLLMKFGENYSASRATLVLFWRIANMWRAEMESDFLNPMVQMFLSEEIAAGRLSAAGWSDPRLRAAWCNCRWIGTGVPNIDPLKEANAAGKRATLGAETLDDIALGYNGSDGAANRAKLRKEIPGLAIGPWEANWRYRDGEDGTDGDTDTDAETDTDEDEDDE